MMPTVLTACSFVSPVWNMAQALALRATRSIVAKFRSRLLRYMASLSYLEVERVGGADADRRLVRATPKRHQRALRRVAEQPRILDIGVNFPMRIDPVRDLSARTGSVRGALSGEGRQPCR